MPIEMIVKATIEATKEIAKEMAKESSKIIKSLDKPLNALETKESVAKELTFKDKFHDLDKPLNYKSNISIEHVISDLDAGIDKAKIETLNENGFRLLNESEKAELKENTKWSDKAINGCKINGDGLIKYPCRNEELAGKANEITGVEYEKQIIEVYGYEVEVVAPEFEYVFEAELPDELIEAIDKNQFKECNRQLYEAIKDNPNLAKAFTEEQLEQIKDGITKGGAPDGCTWHHHVERGKMQLVDYDIHCDSRHTGGKTIWGGGNDFR